MSGVGWRPRWRERNVCTPADQEVERLEAARARAARELDSVRHLLTQRGRSQDAGIFAAQATILGDPKLSARIEEEIRKNLQSAEAAVARVAIEFHNAFKDSDVSMVRDKAADILDVGQRLVRCLDDTAPPEAPTADVIVASSVVPSQLVRYVHQGVVAIITESCGSKSHTAILARGLGVPMVTGIEGAATRIRDGAPVVIDAAAGLVIVDPGPADEETVRRIREAQSARAAVRPGPCAQGDQGRSSGFDSAQYQRSAGSHERDRGGRRGRGTIPDRIPLYGPRVLAGGGGQLPGVSSGCDGLRRRRAQYPPCRFRRGEMPGLCRYPRQPQSEPRHSRGPAAPGASRYSRTAGAGSWLFGRMRPLDRLVADDRHARLTLLQIARRAVLHVAAPGGGGDALPFRLGTMVEVPSAALLIDDIIGHIDSVSVGLNDLTQYLLAADRDDEFVEAYHDPLQPVVLRLTTPDRPKVGNAHDTPVTMCGELAGEPKLTALMLALGVRRISVSRSHVSRIAEALGNLSISDLADLGPAVLGCSTGREVRQLLQKPAA